MKHHVLALLVLAAAATHAHSMPDGKTLFERNECSRCHKPEADTGGPALTDIARAYAGRPNELLQFLTGTVGPRVDPRRFDIMQPHLARTQAMTHEERNAVAGHILLHYPGGTPATR